MTSESDQLMAARRRRADGAVVDFDGQRLAVARRLKRLQRTTLASNAGITPAAVTQFEKGQSRPTRTVLGQLALALGVPTDYLRMGRPITQVPATEAHFRSLRATPALTRDQALAFAETGLAVIDVLEQYVELPGVNLPAAFLPETPSSSEISAAAAEVRKSWGVPSGPIANMVRLVEANGIIALRLPNFIDSAVDAFSTNSGERPLILLSPQKDDKARSRFDAAHELGHLVMHEGVAPGSKLVENQAHGFAAAFLMPEEEIVPDLPKRLDWETLQQAKKKWGVSLRALCFRANRLGLWSDALYRRANIQLSTMGLPEPGPLGPPESPSLLEKAKDLLLSEGISLEEIATSSRFPLEQLESVIAAGSGRKQRKLVVVEPH
ncbi:helix-turn-helix domain-containing protein [Arthrobacter sp. SD76]|uniref:helix-turn-helix domain-containing protein n=1 Tax=Arthrobacter sp. SD76 TaxID=3415007 RepID=UPI003C769A19